MRQKLKIQIIIITVLMTILLVGVYKSYLYYVKPPVVNTETLVAKHLVSSEKLLTSFQLNKDNANSTYVNKIIEVKGRVKEVNYINNRYTVILKDSNSVSQIICDMKPSEANFIEKLTPNETITIKGVCKGYLLDVIMHNCILVN